MYKNFEEIIDFIKKQSGYMEYISFRYKKEDNYNYLIKNTAEEYKKECEEHKKQIATKVDKYRAEGRKVLDEKHWEFWDKIVPIRLDDLYQGMELGASLEIIKVLNETSNLDKAKEIIEAQGHSGMSFGLICSMLREFCDKGEEFVAYARG